MDTIGVQAFNFDLKHCMPVIRDFKQNDSLPVQTLALRAFDQYKNAYTDWEGFQAKIAKMPDLADVGEIIVADVAGKIVGAVVYVGPNTPRAAFFRPEWSILRMLVVAPDSRGRGIGRALTEECLRRAQRDRASVIALHTSEIMEVAVSMYQRLGFKWAFKVPAIHGVVYGVYLKEIES